MNRGTATFSTVARIGPNIPLNACDNLLRVCCPSAVEPNAFFININAPPIAAITAMIGFAIRILNAPSTDLIALPAAPAGPGRDANWSSNC